MEPYAWRVAGAAPSKGVFERPRSPVGAAKGLASQTPLFVGNGRLEAFRETAKKAPEPGLYATQ